jgi:exodeoxyribonuclease V beta subunit
MDLHRTDLTARSRKRHILPAWRISSFSALTRTEYDPDRYETDKFELDRDGKVLPQPAQGGEGINREIRLKTFPKGAGSGDFFHAIFEDLDFQDAPSVEGVVNRHLVKFGFKGQAYGDAALAAVRDILATPLDPDPAKGGGSRAGDPFCLEDISQGQRFTELEFYFDVNTLDLGRLGSLFAGEPDGKSYAAYLSALGATPFKGFIKGFIDLVIAHRGKWYILDYKSNFLGTRYGDYDRGAMQDAMESHHYILQYHLYLVALHRYLGLRLKNYSYDRDFGGVFYLFIRGMHPNQANHGVFFDRPSKAFIDRFLAIL